MATQGTTSRLTQMQMRFQQKQQLERDQKKVELTTSSKSTKTTTTRTSNSEKNSLSSSLGAGKVRQMFDERRHRVAGIDKSYPLQPIQTKVSPGVANSNINNNSLANGKNSHQSYLNNKTRVPPISATTRNKAVAHRYDDGDGYPTTTTATIFSTNGNIFEHDDNENLLENEKFPDSISLDDELLNINQIVTKKLPNVGKLSLKSVNENSNMNSNAVKLKPVTQPQQRIIRKSPAATPQSPDSRSNSSSAKSSDKSSSSPRQSTLRTNKSPDPMTTTKSATRAVISASAVPEGLVPCKFCGRNFLEERIDKHREICMKTKTKKRKTFDVVKHRVQGTEAEKYINRKLKTTSRAKKETPEPAKKSDWRRKHEEFITAIRAAKEMKAYLAKGGKLSDLPPPPPSENPDYVQCPHCSRRFNKSAADRHIPKCATMLHNKPKSKPAAVKKRF